MNQPERLPNQLAPDPQAPGSRDLTKLPQQGFFGVLRQLGPGLIVTGSIVGSGELIATTTLGAKVGFTALWLIVLSCLIKVVVQMELGRYVISSGQTTFQALDKIPGPRWRVSWVVWAWMIMFVGVTLQSGGIIGGVGQVFHLALPQLSDKTWALIVAVISVAILLGGRYGFIESASTVMVVSFTFITVGAAIALAWTPYAIRPAEVLEGLRFDLPTGGLAVAFAVFGITGVGATELIYYPYWCLEKGYARFVGAGEKSPAWLERARGWIRVMQIDALVAMVIYTIATVAFYILGAGVLHSMGQVPAGYEMVRTLSNLYTGTLGHWAYYLFLLGAFFVLYSTIFSATASNSRVVTDFLGLVGAIQLRDDTDRMFWQRVLVVVILAVFTFWYFLVGEPVYMVIMGGIAQACMLPIIGFSTVYLRYKHTEPLLRPNIITDLLLWVSSTVMLSFALYNLVAKLAG
jgi:manganese transport protein